MPGCSGQAGNSWCLFLAPEPWPELELGARHLASLAGRVEVSAEQCSGLQGGAEGTPCSILGHECGGGNCTSHRGHVGTKALGQPAGVTYGMGNNQGARGPAQDPAWASCL